MRKRKLLAIVALVSLLSLLAGGNAALAAPGTYTPPNYPANDPATQLSQTAGEDNRLSGGEGEKKSVVFEVTPTSPGQPRPDGTYEGTNANRTNQNLDNANSKAPGQEGYDPYEQIAPPVSGQYVHGQFKKNTNSCASCHMTHTAAGDALLAKNGIYNTCTACHDGTLGKLNVFDIPSYDAGQEAVKFAFAGGGTFGGVVGPESNASMHLPTGYLALSAAPGGNRLVSGTDIKGNKVETGSWTADFTCSSCHQPHGSYSDRLLAPNPANVMRQVVTVAKLGHAADATGVDDLIYAYNDANNNNVYDPDETRYNGPWVFGENYQAGYTQTVVFDVSNESLLDTAKRPMIAKNLQLNEEFAINYAKGIAKIALTGAEADALNAKINNGEIKIAIVPALVVKAMKGVFLRDDGSTYVLDRTDTDTNNDTYIQGLDGNIILWTGVYTNLNGDKLGNQAGLDNGLGTKYEVAGMAWFCAACHSDYYADMYKKADGQTADLEGRFTSAYRHTINRGHLEESGPQIFVYEIGSSHGSYTKVLTCLSCHYAHGTTKEIMRNADDTPLTAQDAADVNPSSALKRYVNMAVCWKCHSEQHGDELMNSEGYWNSEDVNAIRSSNGLHEIPQ